MKFVVGGGMPKCKHLIAAVVLAASLIPAAAIAARGRYCVPTERLPVGNICILVG